MRMRRLGAAGPMVGAVGFGAMSLSGAYGEADDVASERTVHAALDAGCNLIDTADVYGKGHNERLVGRALRGRRHLAVVCTKFGFVDPYGGEPRIDGRPEYARAAIDGSLRRLGIDHVDLWYLHRLDPTVPIEETVGAMAEAVLAGKVRQLGLSEVGAETIRRAHAVHPIAAVQSEYAIWTRDIENDVLPVLDELGIALVAFSPLGRGLLAGGVSADDRFAEGDLRRVMPRFDPDRLERNVELATRVSEIASRRSITAAQVALAWVLAQSDAVIPIPGTRRPEHVRSNAAAADLDLGDDLAAIGEILDSFEVAGDRYPPALLRLVDTGSRTTDEGARRFDHELNRQGSTTKRSHE